MTDKRHILELAAPDIADWFDRQDEPSYRADQLRSWIYDKYACSAAEMTNLSKELRSKLREKFRFDHPHIAERVSSEDGNTEKFVFELAGGHRIESVAMESENGYTYCISSQSGCPLGCTFCATGAMGYGRDLTESEILGQVLAMAREKGTLGNVVFMGMGEPLLNLKAVLPALESLTDEERFALGTRRITVSTAGITPGIERLSGSPARPNLALSLNSPFQEQRTELMPVNEPYPLDDVLVAFENYADRTGRRLMIEYVLLGGTNTSRDAARAVAGIAGRLGAMVNLIAYNPARGSDYRSPERAEVDGFRDVLEDRGVRVTQRYRRGRDIEAGCGQLAGAKEQ
ncbi:MAG: 23S rRNA (adenine(2503)-C(2))-methyltransferase RlmN [Candidatus Brocadiia bacterium]